MFKRAISIVVAILLLSLTTNYAQGKLGLVGKFLKTSDADILFGKVIKSIPVNTNDLKEAVSNAKDYILFSFKNNQLNITNEKKVKLTARSHDADDKEIMLVFSKSIISALVSFAGEGQIFVEQRSTYVNTFTIKSKVNSNNSMAASNSTLKTDSIMTTASSSIEITLDMAGLCPPSCW